MAHQNTKARHATRRKVVQIGITLTRGEKLPTAAENIGGDFDEAQAIGSVVPDLADNPQEANTIHIIGVVGKNVDSWWNDGWRCR